MITKHILQYNKTASYIILYMATFFTALNKLLWYHAIYISTYMYNGGNYVYHKSHPVEDGYNVFHFLQFIFCQILLKVEVCKFTSKMIVYLYIFITHPYVMQWMNVSIILSRRLWYRISDKRVLNTPTRDDYWSRTSNITRRFLHDNEKYLYKALQN